MPDASSAWLALREWPGLHKDITEDEVLSCAPSAHNSGTVTWWHGMAFAVHCHELLCQIRDAVGPVGDVKAIILRRTASRLP